ncbi:MAG: hypothetical protein LC733_09590, partial [Actinobacteria bacterium]|nr:hypothetical protein [Actinomycetota bacterium]
GYPPPLAGSPGRPWTIAGLVCGILAIIFVPIILGTLGAVFGFIGNSKGDRFGLWVGIGSLVAIVVGIALGIAVLNAVDDGFIYRA